MAGVRVDLKEKRAWVTCGAEVTPQQVVAAIESNAKFHAVLVEDAKPAGE